MIIQLLYVLWYNEVQCHTHQCSKTNAAYGKMADDQFRSTDTGCKGQRKEKHDSAKNSLRYR